jgi:HAD superfamily hydrolase (TIGR01509 family)
MVAGMHERVRRAVEARPGAVELVERLRQTDVRLGLASNSPRVLVDDALRSAELTDAFDVIVTSDDVAHAKPAPDLFLLAAERLELAPAECLVFEDSPNGALAALAAGMRAVLLDPLDLHPESVCPRIRSLGDLIRGGE